MVLVLAGCLSARPAGGAEPAAKAAGAIVTVRKAGCGFIDTVVWNGRPVIAAGDGFVGASVALAPAGDGSAASLFAHRVAETLPAAIDEVRPAPGGLTITGAYAANARRVPFTRRVTTSPDGRCVTVAEEADFSKLPADRAIGAHELHLPLRVHKDPHVRMFAFGAAGRTEMFRMDMNDINRGRTQLISAPRGHWPYWDLGGVVQLAGSYRIWKANHADTMAYPLAAGRGAPGWADYSETDWGVTAEVVEPQKTAPWAITIDARKGLLTFAAHPAGQMPVAARQYGKRAFRLRLTFHETSWPTMRPCELPLKLYRALLADLAVGSNGRPQPYVLSSPFGTADADTIIHRERIQPSTVLRTFYRGDAWRMQGRLKRIGLSVPRNQPMAKWEADARAYLEHIRTHGIPKRPGG